MQLPFPLKAEGFYMKRNPAELRPEVGSRSFERKFVGAKCPDCSRGPAYKDPAILKT